ncbi:MAG: hypothetical protein Q9178_008084, partial [Gyalolechia marmorata]
VLDRIILATPMSQYRASSQQLHKRANSGAFREDVQIRKKVEALAEDPPIDAVLYRANQRTMEAHAISMGNRVERDVRWRVRAFCCSCNSRSRISTDCKCGHESCAQCLVLGELKKKSVTR